jgi:hypothetical protein
MPALLRESMRVPRQRIVPLVGWTSLRIALLAVDFPQPLSPTRPSVSPSTMSKLTSSTAWTWPPLRQNALLGTG